MTFHVIIPAGGSGTRFGTAEKKQFLKIQNETLLNRSIQAFLNTPNCGQVVVSLPEADWQHPSLLKHESVQYVIGGVTRSESVYRGFQALKGQSDDVILVHDGARPLVSSSLIERVVNETQSFGAVIPGLPVSDTIKQVKQDEIVQKTVARASLRAVQTPQGFRYQLLKKAYDILPYAEAQYTDESMLVEALGQKVKMVEGEVGNIKITHAVDLHIADVLLQKKDLL